MSNVSEERSVTLTIDGREVTVPEGTLIIRAAEQLGIDIPRFCDHELLKPAGACRQCLVDIPDAGNGRGFPKPQASCTIPVAAGMVVETASPSAAKAQAGVMEFLLINHPLDCPVCDKGGECPLQNQAMSHGAGETRFDGVKRTYEKPIPVSDTILLDRERCVLCQRCTRFAEEIADDPRLVLIERGARQQVGTVDGEPFDSPYSGNIIDLCPVGALTSTDYRFRARPFDLVSSDSIAEHDACGAAIRVDHRRGKVMRRVPREDAEVNQQWITDRDRFEFRYLTRDRVKMPLIRENGALRVASWPEALGLAAGGLAAGPTAVLTGGRVTLEDARAYATFARETLGTEDIDFRDTATPEETAFLHQHVRGAELVTYSDLMAADVIELVGLDPRAEAGTIDLWLIQAQRAGASIFRTFGRPPADHPNVRKIGGDRPLTSRSVILVGRDAAATPGLLDEAVAAAANASAQLAWVPRRAGDRGAVEAGCFPLPGGRDVDEIVRAATIGQLRGLVLGRVDATSELIDAATRTFTVSLETNRTDLAKVADVVLPIAAPAEKAGTFVTWEGRERPFDRVFDAGAYTDVRVLAELAKRIETAKAVSA
ncbi:NADH-quinone oxidoreductase [Nocardioides baekrokdamisoli]|uniref:NADH-quinone oxidoreductase n=1 Tax=Nocardioides baekrokdamisoli TaxID=1804624 RepID=A0A3G9IFV3_9ACTN|nr:NADH-quinone oxidoreductase subunit NuoG [Nocardioides baekrokdamisoli]BBH17857.1 NADH-quinone oxidoreductase [Nocardioides baekrokdamisoli]